MITKANLLIQLTNIQQQINILKNYTLIYVINNKHNISAYNKNVYLIFIKKLFLIVPSFNVI